MIEFHRATLSYPGTPGAALSSIDLVIEEGSDLAVMGANGSGKSTLARCMNGTLLPESGQVTVDGMSTGTREYLRPIRQKVGMVFQYPHLQFIASTVEAELAFGLENLGLPSDDIRLRVEQQLASFGLEGLKDRTPFSLSAGEQQRVMLAAVMLTDPKYLVLDEATTFLAPTPRKILLRHVRDLHERHGTAIIHVTQNPGEALEADRLLVLHLGQVWHDGSPEVLLERRQELAALGVPLPLVPGGSH